jgi:hypothetical protein
MNEFSADLGVTELSSDELQTSGGIVWLAVGLAVGGFIVANWPDIKQGASDGWNS